MIFKLLPRTNRIHTEILELQLGYKRRKIVERKKRRRNEEERKKKSLTSILKSIALESLLVIR